MHIASIIFRSALTELCVLSDILQLSTQKKYLVLDPVQVDPPEPKLAVQLMYKKRVGVENIRWFGLSEVF